MVDIHWRGRWLVSNPMTSLKASFYSWPASSSRCRATPRIRVAGVPTQAWLSLANLLASCMWETTSSYIVPNSLLLLTFSQSHHRFISSTFPYSPSNTKPCRPGIRQSMAVRLHSIKRGQGSRNLACPSTSSRTRSDLRLSGPRHSITNQIRQRES